LVLPLMVAASVSHEPPAVLAIEKEGAAHEPADVLPPLAGRTAAVMHRAKRRQVGCGADLVEAHAPVVVLEIEKKFRVEAARRVDRLPAHEHAAAGHHRQTAHRQLALRIDDVPELVPLEAAREQPPYGTRRVTPQEQIEDRRISLA